MKIVWVVLVVLGSGPPSASELGQDIRQQVKERGEVEIRITKQYSPLDLEGLVAGVDLVIRGVVAETRSALVENKVVTDYKVQIILVICGKNASVEGATITIRRDGGKVQIDGGTVNAYEPDFPFFEIGKDYILFLKRSADQLYFVRDGAQGAFRIEAGKVSQVSERAGTWNRERGAVDVVQFLNEIALAGRKQGPERKAPDSLSTEYGGEHRELCPRVCSDAAGDPVHLTLRSVRTASPTPNFLTNTPIPVRDRARCAP